MSTDWSADPDFQYLAVDRKKLMKEQTQSFDGKKACWVPDAKEGFARAEIQSTKGEEVTVKIEKNNDVSIEKDPPWGSRKSIKGHQMCTLSLSRQLLNAAERVIC